MARNANKKEITVRNIGRASLKRAWLLTCAATLMVMSGACSSNKQFSDKELQQMKEGPPAEMPAEARKMMGEMGSRRTPPPPPRPKGQPGPGAPF